MSWELKIGGHVMSESECIYQKVKFTDKENEVGFEDECKQRGLNPLHYWRCNYNQNLSHICSRNTCKFKVDGKR